MDIAKIASERLIEIARLTKERDELRAKLAARDSQEPVGLVKTIGGYPDESEHVVEWLVKYRQITDGQYLYAKPVPAEQVPDAIQLLQRVAASTTDKPAVAVPDCAKIIRDLAQEFKEAWPDDNGKYAWLIGYSDEFKTVPSHSEGDGLTDAQINEITLDTLGK